MAQKFKLTNQRKRRNLVNWPLNNKALNKNFANKILYNEVHFHLDGYVSKRNCRGCTLGESRFGELMG